jgi:hypothetical protein
MLTHKRITKWKSTAINALVTILILFMWLNMGLAQEPTYNTAVVDGDYGEWDLTNDYFADMYKAASTSKPVLSKLYLRYDCSSSILYALILSEPGIQVVLDIAPANLQDPYIKVNGNLLVNGTYGNYGTPPDIEWIGLSGDSHYADGWEASVPLSQGNYIDLNVHNNIWDSIEQQTSAVANRAINLSISCPEIEYDFGDAPDPLFPTLLANNGARHIITNGFNLGPAIDAENDGLPDANAQGDDNDNVDDEDGIDFVNDLMTGDSAFIKVTASASGVLNAWIDFNADGDWLDINEQIFTNQALNSGTTSLNIQIPANAVPSTTFARFRFNSAGNLSPNGLANDGEVEDYKITIHSDKDNDRIPDDTETCTEDRDSDGILNCDDYDPSGYIYNEITGEIIAGGSISVAGPGSVSIVHDGSSGFYEFYTDGTLGTYTITLTVPPGYEVSETCLPQDPPAYNPTGLSNPVILGNSEDGSTGYLTSTACTPFYYSFALEPGDPFIITNNFPLKHPNVDYGDAPDPTFPTLLASAGAHHYIINGMFLGAGVDADADGQGNATSTGDDADGNDDDDGVTFTSPLMQFDDNTIDVVASANGYLNAWIDLNQDGDWDDAGEHVFVDESLSAGTNNLTLTLPLITDLGAIRTEGFVSRFRFSSEQGLGYTGLAADGEVEDYIIDVVVPIELGRFSSTFHNGLVTLHWETRSETANLGFNIYRKEGSSTFVKVNRSLIPGAGSSESVNHYSFTDKSVETGKIYTYRLEDMNINGVANSHKTITVKTKKPNQYSLEQNYPNPFNPETSITFSIKKAGHVELKIFNVNGELVQTLIDGIMGAGTYTKTWNGTDTSKNIAPSGTYIYTILVDGYKQSKKMTLLK